MKKTLLFIFLCLIIFSGVFFSLFIPVTQADTVINRYFCYCGPSDDENITHQTYYTTDTACIQQCNQFCTNWNSDALEENKCQNIPRVLDKTGDQNNPPATDPNNPPQSNLNNPPANSTIQKETLDNPLGVSTIPAVIGKIIKIFLGLIGTISLVMFIYGGFLIFSAMGEAGKVKTGRQTLVYASIGIIVVLTSYVILKFVLNVFNLK